MRDIGEQAGVPGGSLYHRIKSKDALFVELHNPALDEAERKIRASVRLADGLCSALEQACVTMLEI